MAVIRLEKLRKEFGSLVAVRDVTITFPTSTVTCLLGPSGCGKTTLHADHRRAGGADIRGNGFDDERVTDMSPAKRNIGMVFQYPVVYRISVYRNIELPLLEDKPGHRAPQAHRKRGGNPRTQGQPVYKDVGEIDTGTRQKVAVARAGRPPAAHHPVRRADHQRRRERQDAA
ncbi:MAG: ATP-binding cassette domain-containing protein [Anaerolineae bacterium]